MNNKIYLIMVMEMCEVDEKGWPDFGGTRIVGYFTTFEAADEAVRNNCGDIWETCYEYALIEAVGPGLYTGSKERWFYSYDHDTDGYEHMVEPDFVKHFCGLTIG